ncbi:predicted protein [Arabidopsis lyrata subsp. lyrata]|uniref:Predicted protein n=1 Tax=Arabidopsis lyrata subsp. lyrata TaxID=81972 RepID=D7MA35_ARALL|nr:predicted protein [Arabidopsis lyrata subsp. lyrata]
MDMERGLGNFRTWVCNSSVFLIVMGVVTLSCSMISLWMMFILPVDKIPTWLNILLYVIYTGLIIYVIVYYTLINNGNRNVLVDHLVPRGYPNCACIVRGFGKALVLGFFVLADSTLEKKNKVWVILFCLSSVLHVIHMMVVFGFREEFDVAGGLIQAFFVMFCDIIKPKVGKKVHPLVLVTTAITLVLVTIVLNCYKTLLLEGVAVRREEQPVVG